MYFPARLSFRLRPTKPLPPVIKIRFILPPNSAYSPSVCAERTAIFKAVSEGNLEFEKIAVVGGAKGEAAYNLCSPCGVCREVMSEFCDPDTFEIVMSNGKEDCVVMTLGELLPGNFGFTELER